MVDLGIDAIDSNIFMCLHFSLFSFFCWSEKKNKKNLVKKTPNPLLKREFFTHHNRSSGRDRKNSHITTVLQQTNKKPFYFCVCKLQISFYLFSILSN